MKAEHRKELETNILADKMGRMISTAKQGPSRGFVFYFVIGLVLCIAIWAVFRFLNLRRSGSSESWFLLEDGTGQDIAKLTESYKNNANKAAHFQTAWATLWFRGLKQLGSSPKQAFSAIDEAETMYKQLAEKCKGDPVYEPEALYGLAVIEETRLVKKVNRESVQPVIEKYNAVIKVGKNSSFAALATKRIEDLEKNEGRAVLEFYQDLDRVLDRLDRPLFPPNFDMNRPEDFEKQLNLLKQQLEQQKKK